MSYPPRPPMGMGMGMPVGMQFGYAPMGMMPMTMNMTPMLRYNVQQPSAIQQQQIPPPRPFPRAIQPHVPEAEKPPVTTVFVGNISEKAPDGMMRQMLQRCGHVLSWKRVQGASGKLQGFGFCEYEHPEATLRCIRLLNEWTIVDKNLLVKVDAKTKSLLDEYNSKKKMKQTSSKSKEDEKEDGEAHSSDEEKTVEEEPLDEFVLREDRVAKAGLDAIMREYNADLTREPRPDANGTRVERDDQSRTTSMRKTRDPDRKLAAVEQMNIGEETKDLIHKEIRSFRDAHKDEQGQNADDLSQRPDRSERDKEREKERENDREVRRRRDEERDREKDRDRKRTGERDENNRQSDRDDKEKRRGNDKDQGGERDREKGGREMRDRETAGERNRDKGEREREREKERGGGERRGERDRGRDKEREGERERDRGRDKDREGERERDRSDRDRERGDRSTQERPRSPRARNDSVERVVVRDDDDEEDDHERRRLERQLRDKEIAYQEMLAKWEIREERKGKDYEKDTEKEDKRKSEELKESRKLKAFLEDYDDNKDDIKYFTGSALQRRLKEREKEKEMDDRDRQKEKVELEKIHQRLTDEGHPDIEAEMARIEQEHERHLQPRFVDRSSPVHERRRSLSPVIDISRSPDPYYSDDDAALIIEDPGRSSEQTSPMYPARGIATKEIPSPENSPTIMPENESQSNSTDFVVSKFKAVSNMNVALSGAHVNSAPHFTMSDDSASGLMSADVIPSVATIMKRGDDEQKNKLGFSGIQLGNATSPSSLQSAAKRKKVSMSDVFNADEDETSVAVKSRKLTPINYSFEERQAVLPPGGNKATSAEEKRKAIKTLIERIPTGKEELFAFQLDWTMVDSSLMERRIRPWVNKKILEYIGEDEPTLSEFICKKVTASSTPSTILADISMVLDEEAEVFVVKMWRLLIYETEAKKLGLVK